jgi:hypothetical protein
VKRNPEQRSLDYIEIARRSLKGDSLGEIAEYINSIRSYTLSRQQIWRDLKAIHDEWRREYTTTYDEAIRNELAKIDELERTYWIAWDESKKKKEMIRATRIADTVNAGGTEKPSYSRTKTEKREEQRDGDIRFLEGVERCIEKRCKLLGLNAPDKVDVLDWRAEAQRIGVENPGELFNALVAGFVSGKSPLG